MSTTGSGANPGGFTVNLAPRITPWSQGRPVPAPLRLYAVRVPPDWIDYHGHMSEPFYLMALSDAIDPFFEFIGAGAAYRAGGSSFFTVSWRLDLLGQVREGATLEAATALIGHDEKRMHLLHRLFDGDRRLVATGELVMLHVDLGAGRASAMAAHVATALSAIAAEHVGLALPATAGRGLSLRRPKTQFAAP